MPNPREEVERSRRLLERARAEGRCEDAARAVGQALENLAAEAGFSTGETASAGAGVLGIGGGILLGLLGLLSGVGAIIMIAIGLLVLLGAGGHRLDTISDATRRLRQANDALEECLGR